MNALNAVVQVPSWAYDFCYYYLAVAALVVVTTLWGVVKMLALPGIVKKFIPATGIILSLLLSGAVTTVLAMMQFWVCRSALKPSTEKFAVACSSDADCTAVMGTPQNSLCSCGGRGFCGGCVMQNNMEPSMLPEYDSQFASMAEGFKNHTNHKMTKGNGMRK